MTIRLKLGMVAVAAALLTTGCATAADSSPPTPVGALIEDYGSEAERVISMALRDPGSAIYDHRIPPYVLVCKRGVFGNSTTAEFWAAEVWVNARNGFGGYTGPQPYTVVFIPEPVTGEVRMQAQVGLGGGRMVSASGICWPR